MLGSKAAHFFQKINHKEFLLKNYRFTKQPKSNQTFGQLFKANAGPRSAKNSFVYSDISSNNDLNQLMFIIRYGRLFVVNDDT